MATKGKNGKIIFSPGEVDFLKTNFLKMTNQQLADALGLKLTVVRQKCYELGLRRIEMEYWTPDMVRFLKTWYRKKGDVELAEIFNVKFPKNKPWTRNHIVQKRGYLKLKRTTKSLNRIFLRNKETGRLAVANTKRFETLPASPLGTIVEREGKKKIKTSKGYSSYARYVYLKNYGPIEEHEVIIHLDGNAVNCSPANLFKINRSTHFALNKLMKYFSNLNAENRAYVKKYYLGLISDNTDAASRNVFAIKSGYKNISEAVLGFGGGSIFSKKFTEFKNNYKLLKPIL